MTRGTVADLLARAKGLGVPRLDAHRLITQVLKRPRAWLIAHDDAAVDPRDAEAVETLLSRRAQGIPLAYLVGEKEFHGLTLQVTPAVLIPRPETELAVDWALELLHDRPGARVLDLGTGSGAIAIAVKLASPHTHVVAVDRFEEAIAVAQGNARRLGADIEFLRGDWFSGWSQPPFDLVVSNPPYIDADDPHLPALQDEPLHALSPGPEGLSALVHLARTAPSHVIAGGQLILEHGHQQGPGVRQALESAGWVDVHTRCDLAGLPRCTAGRMP